MDPVPTCLQLPCGGACRGCLFGSSLDGLIRGGTAELAMGRAALTAARYASVALAVTLLPVSRRDVTA